MTDLPSFPVRLIAAVIMLLAPWPSAAVAADWHDHFRDLVLSENDSIAKAEWVTQDIFWASIPDTAESRNERAESLCEYVTEVSAPDSAQFRIHLWSAQQRDLGRGIVLGEAQCAGSEQ